MRTSVDPIAAEARALESGAHAMLQADGSFLVRSASRDDVRHRVRVEPVYRGGWLARLRCECESGSARPGHAVACWHGALVGRRLEREGYARWHAGAWWLTPLGYERLGAGPPKTRKARGPCPVCREFMSIRVFVDDERDPREVAAEHTTKCRTSYAERRGLVAEQPDVDLWERDEPWKR